VCKNEDDVRPGPHALCAREWYHSPKVSLTKGITHQMYHSPNVSLRSKVSLVFHLKKCAHAVPSSIYLRGPFQPSDMLCAGYAPVQARRLYTAPPCILVLLLPDDIMHHPSVAGQAPPLVWTPTANFKQNRSLPTSSS